MSEKLGLLLRLSITQPLEFWDRLATILQYRGERGKFASPNYQTAPFDENVRQLEKVLGCDLTRYLAEPELASVTAAVAAKVREANDPDLHAGDSSLARICYAVCRALRPETVVETGVSYGATTAHILQAFAVNKAGHLWSVDLPPLHKDAEKKVGSAIPEHLKSRWTLVRGNSQRYLPGVLAKAGTIDLFIHDSLHTYKNELFEFSAAWPNLRPGGVLVSDDIEAHPAWQEWEARVHPEVSVVFQEEDKTTEYAVDLGQKIAPKFGVMVKARSGKNQ